MSQETEKLIEVIALIAAWVVVIFIHPTIGVVSGALCGWIVGVFFTDTVIGFLSRIGVDTDGLAVWEVGAALGFLGGFFKSVIKK